MSAWIGLALGPAMSLVCALAPSPLISQEAWYVIGLAAWIVIWWVSEAIPIGITSLLPIIYLSLTGVTPITEASAPYASPIVFLFLGGFILALSLEKWGIHKRVALKILSFTGVEADGVILGFMVATALLSMWMSNTATTLMMLPIALSVLTLMRQGEDRDDSKTSAQDDRSPHEKSTDLKTTAMGGHRDYFAIALMLGVAYAANIGGTMTLIGTPPNLVLANHFETELQQPITFLSWLKIGVPFGLVALTFTYFLLVKVLYRNRLGEVEGAQRVIDEASASLGTWSTGAIRVSVIFLCTALAWVFRAQLIAFTGVETLTDTTVGLIGATTLFIISDGRGGRLMTWTDMYKLPWDIVLLFGGGLSLAAALKRVGIMQAIGDQFGHMGGVTFLSLSLLTLVALLLTEVMSNVALVSVFVPVISAVALGLNISPLLLCVPVTLAASCAFMLPMSTPPNAIVFASGELKIRQMVKAGLVLNVVSVLWISLLTQWLLT